MICKFTVILIVKFQASTKSKSEKIFQKLKFLKSYLICSQLVYKIVTMPRVRYICNTNFYRPGISLPWEISRLNPGCSKNGHELITVETGL